MEKKQICEFLFKQYTSYSKYDVLKNNFNEDSALDDLGLDSVDYMKIVLDIEEQYNFEFDNEELAMQDINSIRDMSEFIYKKILFQGNY